jgi:polysaccharide biosynthesis/export protein
MKKTLFFVLLFSGFLNTFAQNISPKLKSLLDQLPPSQRNIILSEYQNDVSNSLPKASFFSTNAPVSAGTIPGNSKPSSDSDENDLKEQNRRSKLMVLGELELLIEQDIEQSKLNLDTITRRQPEDPLSTNGKTFLLDRIYDLEEVLRNIRTRQLELIEKETKVFDLKQTPDLFPFGYDAFNRNLYSSDYDRHNKKDYNFAIPSNYKIGPGDLLEVQFYGQEDAQYSLTIGRNGILQLPRVGPFNVLEKGNSFQSLKSLINEKVNEKLGQGIGVSVSLGELRQIKVFLAGEFKKPGLKLTTAGSSILSLLLNCGGMNEIASLRSLTLKREGTTEKTFDLYDLLLKGESATSILEDGDVVFLPTVKNRVWVEGKVMRPAIYEITNEVTLSAVIELSGGFTDRAMVSSISLKRVSEQGEFVSLKTLDFNKDADFLIKNGDHIEVFPVIDSSINAITLTGEINLAKKYEWRKGIRISDIINSKSFYTTQADLNYALIRREDPQGNVSILSFSPNRVLSDSRSEEDLILLPMDRLIILSSTESSKRERQIRPLREELRYEGRPGRGVPSVKITGMVHFPGEYPYTPNMTISGLIVAGGGMTGSAYTLSSELSRQSVDLNSSIPTASIAHSSLDSLLSRKTLDMKLQAKDILSIKPIPSWSENNSIEILGEVRFPGTYTFQKNETLKSIFDRAGGFTQSAFPKGAVFTRQDLIKREEEQKKRLISQLETDVANISLAAGSGETAIKAKSVSDSLLTKLRDSKSMGRLVLDLNDQVSKSKENSIVVRNGDRLYVPSIPFEISVIGEVQFATSHLFESKLDLHDYIQRSGGFTANADEGRVFVVKSDGSVLTKGNASGWFKSSNSRQNLESGDVIVVPINLEKGKWMETLTSSTQIVYQLAVAAAAVNSF